MTKTAGRIGGKQWLRRLAPLAVLVAGLGLFFAFGLDRYVGLEALREHRHWLLAQVEANALLAGLVFVAVYALVPADPKVG